MDNTCPICKKTFNSNKQKNNEEQKFYPFCSERCKLVDLGLWLDADYKILSAQKSQESDQDFDLPD